MKYRPMLFSSVMVRALLAGTKTQARMIVKPQPGPEFWEHRGYELVICDDGLMRFAWKEDGKVSPLSPEVRCPYGIRGDQLWVKETARCSARGERPPEGTGYLNIEYRAGGESKTQPYDLAKRSAFPSFPKNSHSKGGGLIWHPSIFLPRWASRITLEITSVRVERLQEISEADAIAEGAQRHVAMQSSTGNNTLPHHGYYFGLNEHGEMSNFGSTASEAFSFLWAALNGWKSWDLDLYVWVIEFKRMPA